jgi:hypothetical protein
MSNGCAAPFRSFQPFKSFNAARDPEELGAAVKREVIPFERLT